MPIIVKALQKDGPDRPFKVVEIERRDPRPDDVVIDIKAAGICHSDIHTIRNECCLLYTSPSPRDVEESRMPSSA